MIDEIGDCSICLKYKKAPLKQVVGLSLSKHFNVISMDLKEINGHKILHMVDHATRFSSAAVIKSKQRGNSWGNFSALDCFIWSSK